jgi:hypothetical protein
MYDLQTPVSIRSFQLAALDEKNEKSKQLIGKKIEEYLARAEALKGQIQSGEKQPKKAVGVDGSMNGASTGDQK